jgi:hypothetical protein
MSKIKHLRDVYRFTNFRPEFSVKGVFGDPMALVIRLHRRSKKHFAEFAGQVIVRFTTGKVVTFETWVRGTDVFICGLRFVVWTVVSAWA